MATYLFQVAYTSESWATQVAQQGNVRDRITPLAQACGGSITSCFYCFGDDDLIVIADFASPEGAAAFSLAATSGGAVKRIRTTELLSVEQGIRAMHQAADARAAYTPPVPGAVAAQRAESVAR